MMSRFAGRVRACACTLAVVGETSCVRPQAAAPASLGAGPIGSLVASNMSDNTATVLDAATGRVLATLPTGEGPHEVAISHDGRWALVSNYGVRGRPGASLTVIDIVRLVVSQTIELGAYQRPHGLAFFPGDTLVAVTSETSQLIVLVTFPGGRIAGTIPT